MLIRVSIPVMVQTHSSFSWLYFIERIVSLVLHDSSNSLCDFIWLTHGSESSRSNRDGDLPMMHVINIRKTNMCIHALKIKTNKEINGLKQKIYIK